MQEKINSTLIGFDYGLKKIGVSIGNTVSGVASPLKILYSKSKIEGFKAAKEEIFFWDPLSARGLVWSVRYAGWRDAGRGAGVARAASRWTRCR